MRKIQHDNIRSIAVKQDALNEIYTHFDEFHKTTVFQEECRSWFKDGKIKNRIYLWPGPVSAVVLRIHRAIFPPTRAAALPHARWRLPSPKPFLPSPQWRIVPRASNAVTPTRYA